MNPEKPVRARNVPAAAERPRRQIPHNEIAARAERLWHERNRPSGVDDAIWLEAESQLRAEAEMKPASGADSLPDRDAAAQKRSATTVKSGSNGGRLRNQ